jgi:uncharacterized membrane protein YvbJ
LVFCGKCGTENSEESKFCSNCGRKLIQNKTTGKLDNGYIPQNMEKSSVWNNLILDFPAIGKGLLVSLLIGIFIAGFIGIFFGGMLTGYSTKIKKMKYISINGWIVGFISIIVWAIIGLIFQLPNILGIHFEAVSTVGLDVTDIISLLIGMLIASILFGLIGAIGAVIGLKLSNRKNKNYYIENGD